MLVFARIGKICVETPCCENFDCEIFICYCVRCLQTDVMRDLIAQIDGDFYPQRCKKEISTSIKAILFCPLVIVFHPDCRSTKRFTTFWCIKK